jgi:hypothetical protein
VEDSHSRVRSRVAQAKEDAKDLVELAAVGLDHEVVLVHMDSGILAVDDWDPGEVSTSRLG